MKFLDYFKASYRMFQRIQRLIQSREQMSRVLSLVREHPTTLTMRTSVSRNTILHMVAKSGDTELLYAMLQLVEDMSKMPTVHSSKSLPTRVQLLNAQNRMDETPLAVAAATGRTAMVVELLHLGSDWSLTDRLDNSSVLHTAVKQGHVPTVEAILQWAADHRSTAAAPQQLPPQHARVFNASLTTDVTSSAGSDQVQQASVGGPVGILAVPNTDGAMHAASAAGIDDGVARISSTVMIQGVSVPLYGYPTPSSTTLARLLSMETSEGSTALHFAADAGHIRIVEILCQYGAKIDAVMGSSTFWMIPLNSGSTPLHMSAEMGHTQVVHTLLRHHYIRSARNPDLNDPRAVRDRTGFLPYQLATFADHVSLARILKPEYPLRRLFRDINLQDFTLPKLSCIAGAVVRTTLLGQLHTTVTAMSWTNRTCGQASGAQSAVQRADCSSIPSSADPVSSDRQERHNNNNNHTGSDDQDQNTASLTEVSATSQQDASESGIAKQVLEAGDGGQCTAAGEAAAADSPAHELVGLIQYATSLAGYDVSHGAQQEPQTHSQNVEPLQSEVNVDEGVVAGDAAQAQAQAHTNPDTAQGNAANNKHGQSHSSWLSSIESLTTSADEAELESMRAAYMQHAARGTLQRVVRYMKRGSRPGSLTFNDEVAPALSTTQPQVAISTPGKHSTAVDNAPVSDDGHKSTCDVCFEPATLVKIRPCSHDMCVQCTTKLLKSLVDKPVLCPFCRRNIVGIAGPSLPVI